MNKKYIKPMQVTRENLLSFENPIVRTERGNRRASLRFKRLLWEYSNRRCRYCGAYIDSYKTMNIDHIVSQAEGGSDDPSNLGSSCRPCNNSKNSREKEFLKYSIALRGTGLREIISPLQAKKLMDKGINLGVVIKPFYYEVADESN